MQLPIIDLAVIAVYFLGVLGCGAWFMRQSSSSEGFTAAGRSLPGWVCGLSIFATFVSSISFLANPGKSYDGNWNPFVWSLTLPFATWVAVRYFLPLYRARGEVSAYGYLESRFGVLARLYASTFYLLTQLSRIGMVTLLTAIPLSVLLGIDKTTLILIIGVSVTLYSLMGGITAVIWTDAVQAVVLIGGALLCAVWMLVLLPEGPGQMFEIANANDKFSFGSYDFKDWLGPTVWVVALNGIFANLQNFGIDQNYIQRYITSKTDADARKAVWLGGLLYVPVSFMFFFIGTELYSYYTVFAEKLPADIPSDRVFPYFIVHELPKGLTGLLVAGVLAAAMSTISTGINSSSTVIYNDFFKRLKGGRMEESTAMLILRVTTVVFGGLGMGVSLYLASIDNASALDLWWALASVFSGGMLGLFLLGFFVRRAGPVSALVGMIFGLISIFLLSLPKLVGFFLDDPEPLKGIPVLGFFVEPVLNTFMVVVVGTSVIFVTGYLVSLVCPGEPEPAQGN